MDATILSGRIKADKWESRLVTAQVFRPLDERSEAKREKFAVKGRKRGSAPAAKHEERHATKRPGQDGFKLELR